MLNRKVFFAVLLALLAIALVPAAQAQTATVSGTISDQTGAVVPGVSVTAQNKDTNVSRTANADETGTYRITNLVPGSYDLTFAKTGFRTIKYTQLQLTVSQSLTLDVKVEISAVAEVIEVSGTSIAPIELENQQISNVIDSRTLTDLPLLTRDPYSLISLGPGVVTTNSGLGGFAVNGSRERNNNFLLDGVDNNDTDVPGIAGGITSLNPDATQEFRVISANFLPEFGRNTGAVVDIVTRSGTNEIHGRAYWFGRFDALGARDFFNHNPDAGDPTKLEPIAPYTRNTAGGQIGGPIRRDKTFWFVNFEAQRFKTSLINTSVVPTPEFKTGLFNFTFDECSLPGTCTPSSPTFVQRVTVPVDVRTPGSPSNRFGFPRDPTILSILDIYPAPNAGNLDLPGSQFRGLFRFPSESKQNTESVATKIDHHFNQNHVLSGRYNFNRFKDPNPFHTDFLPASANNPLLGNITAFQRTQSFSLNLTSTLRSNLVNEFRFGVNRTNLPFNCGGAEFIDSFGGVDPVGYGRDFTFFTFSGFDCAVLGDSNGQARFTGTTSWVDNLTWVKGRHTIKGGFELRFVYSNSFTDFFSRQSLNMANFSNFGIRATTDLDPTFNPTTNPTQVGSTTLQNEIWALLGVVGFQTQSQYFNKAGTRTADDLRGFRQRESRLYLQDSWKVTPHFTLNLGLAWAFYGVPYEVDGNFSTLRADPSGFAPFTFEVVGRSPSNRLYENDFKNFEPRIGFAWDPFKKGTTSIRGGYGIFHDRLFGNLFINARGNPPFQRDAFEVIFDSLPFVPIVSTQTPTPVANDGDLLFPVLFQRNFKVPYSQTWSLGVQREFFRNLVVELDYVATKGNRVFRVVDGNPPQPDLVAALVAFCSVPNAFDCTESTLQFTTLWAGADFFGNIPFNAVNNNAFFQTATNTSQGLSNYQSMQLKVTKRMSRGLQMRGTFTWAHSIDDSSDPLVAGAGNRSFPRNSLNLRAERGDSDFDVRRRVTLDFIYEIPLGRGRQYLSDGPIGKIFEGWQFSGIYIVSDGLPYSIFTNVDTEHTGLSARADLVGNPAIPAGSDRTQTGPPVTAFATPPFGRGGNVGRNVFNGPGVNNWDLVLAKTTTVTERIKFELRFESYNMFNRVQLGTPGNSIASPGTFGVSTFQVGRPDGTAGSRQIQFGAKVHF